PLVLQLVLRFAVAGALHEAEGCREVGAELEVTARVIDVAPVALELGQGTESRDQRAVVQLAVLAADQLADQRPALPEPQPAVERVHPVDAPLELAVGDEEADRRLLPQLALDPERPHAGPAAGERIGRRHAAGLPVVDGDGAQGPPAGLAGEPQTAPRINDAA